MNEESTTLANETSNTTTGNKCGGKPKHATDEERREARRIRQRNYYNPIKDERRELLNLQALRRYYRKKIHTNDEKLNESEGSERNEKLDTEKFTAKFGRNRSWDPGKNDRLKFSLSIHNLLLQPN